MITFFFLPGSTTLEKGRRGRGRSGRSCEKWWARGHGVERTAHEWGVDDSVDVAGLEIRHPNEAKDLSPGGNNVFFH